MPTVPSAVSPSTIGSVIPGRTPRRTRACAALWVADRRVRTTSSDASWNDPTRLRSPDPITVPSRSVMMTLKPMISLVSPAISWASAEVNTGAALDTSIVASVLQMAGLSGPVSYAMTNDRVRPRS
jgi:hypothetical protein